MFDMVVVERIFSSCECKTEKVVHFLGSILVLHVLGLPVCVFVCVREGQMGLGTTSATTSDVKKLGNVLFRTCFFYLQTSKKKQKDLKVIQGHTHYPSINYTTGFD